MRDYRVPNPMLPSRRLVPHDEWECQHCWHNLNSVESVCCHCGRRIALLGALGKRHGPYAPKER